MSKDAYYFSHDCNARRDPKILEMRSEYGMVGFGWFWVLIEMLREQKDYKLKLSRCNAYALEMQCTPDEAKKFIIDCIDEFELFISDGEYFWSESLLRRMDEKEQKSKQAKAAAQARWGKKGKESTNNANAMQTQSECNAIKIKESKEKEIKVKESKENNIAQTLESEFGRPVSPTEVETLEAFVNCEIEPAVVVAAIKEAKLQGKPTVKYIDGILRNCLAANIKTLAAFEIATQEFRNRNSKQNQRGQPQKTAQPSKKYATIYQL